MHKESCFYVRYFECQCHSDEHTLKFQLDDIEDIPDEDIRYADLYVTTHLSDWPGFFRRLWRGLKYVFGYKCNYGHFDTFIMQDKDVDDFIKLFEMKKELIKMAEKERKERMAKNAERKKQDAKNAEKSV